MQPAPVPATPALRLARRSWRLIHQDPAAAYALAERALAGAMPGAGRTADPAAEGWARLSLGYHLLYHASPELAMAELNRAQRAFDVVNNRPGHILAQAGLARALWRDGRFRDAIDRVLPLRDEGLQVLRNEQRGLLLHTIAGCYSARGESEQAFAYLYEALRDAGPARGHGVDVVLHCNLAHELLQLGDHDEALRYVGRGIERSAGLKNPRLVSVLLINRIVCLTELGRAAEALPDVRQVHAMPTDTSVHGRGAVAPHFETLAITALRAGDAAYGRELLACVGPTVGDNIPDERLELAIARSLEAQSRGDLGAALAVLAPLMPLAAGHGVDGASLRVRCAFQQTLSQLHEQLGDSAEALSALRLWQQLHVARVEQASRARYQASSLQTELLRLRHRIDEKDAQRRATERARAELQQANEQLSRTVHEVQALQHALREQATRDALTGLYNRRHLNDALPALLALALRDGQPLAVALIDLDHFKTVNDTHGHGAGDELLAAFGQLLQHGLRQSDVACRYGGEEFCVLMPSTGAAAARRKVHALLRRWREQCFAVPGATLAGLTFSAGVCEAPRSGTTAQALLKAADDELLAAKRGGRGRVRLAAPAADDPAQHAA